MRTPQATGSRKFSILHSQFSIPQSGRGSALIITMLVVATISAAAFGLSQIFLADLRVATSAEDSLKAFYAAEAGTEEGLLRYRVDRTNETLNNNTAIPTRFVLDGQYVLSTTYLANGPVDSVTEHNGGLGNLDFPNGDIFQDQTFEVATSPNNTGTVAINWVWDPGPPSNPECGVEVTNILDLGGFEKFLYPGTSGSSSDSGARVAIRVKPLCASLDTLTLTPQGEIGRTLQTIDSTGTVGRAKRKLQAVLNRRTGSLVGIFDFILGSEENICQPVGSC